MTDTMYADVDDLAAFVGIRDSTDDVILSAACLAASRVIDGLCGRRFYPDATATARVFNATNPYRSLLTADFYSTTDLVIASDLDNDGAFEATLTAAEYALDGLIDGGPYDTIRVIGSQQFSGRVQVTAMWGWATPPEPIQMATLLLAKDLFKNKDTVGGVLGTDQFGAVRVRQDPYILTLIQPYQRQNVAG